MQFVKSAERMKRQLIFNKTGPENGGVKLTNKSVYSCSLSPLRGWNWEQKFGNKGSIRASNYGCRLYLNDGLRFGRTEGQICPRDTCLLKHWA